MLTLHPLPGRPRLANNLLPTSDGRLASRPAVMQIVSGDLASAVAWGNRLLCEKQGRIVLWAGAGDIDIAPAGRGLQATSFQALTADAQREDRLYVADGINPLWFIARRAGAFARHTFTNKVKDAAGTPYPLAAAQAVATWRGRLWFSFGTNRAQHCQFDDTEYWDPLWTVECQGPESDRIVAFAPLKTRLAVGLQKSVWQVVGDSHLNWQRDALAGYGVAGPAALRAHDDTLYWAAPTGCYQLGREAPLSEDIREAFASPQYPCETALDLRRRLLLLLAAGRLFVMHLDQPGKWGEITGYTVRGLIQMADYVGWYGADGAWVLGARDMPDRRLDGTTSEFTSLFDTWDDVPNPDGDGRAVLTRSVLVAAGSDRGNVTYTATVDSNSYTGSASLTDVAVQRWSDQISGLGGEPWPTAPVRREFTPYLAGTRFRHRVEAPCHLELYTFAPKYKFGEAA